MATAQTEIRVTPEIAAEHGVTAEEYARIQKILGRDPNITELGIRGLRRRTSWQLTTKSVSIKDVGGKSGGRASKAAELIAGDLRHVADSRLRVK